MNRPLFDPEHLRIAAVVRAKAWRRRWLDVAAAFLASFNNHFCDEGHGIFAKIYKDYPVDYFWGLITLAKVMKIEIGGPNEFDRPATEDEALDRLERNAGPMARKMLEQFLKQVKKAEAKYLEEEQSAN